MPYLTVGKESGTNIEIYYKDWGTGQPIVFSHGWPLSADDWDAQMLFFMPVLVMHGDDDQIVPYADSGPLSAKLLKNGMLKTYKGFPHGMPTTEAETINTDLLAFING
jgi:pimeloyl-ACP methyl ester carboxylesterase